MTFTPSCGVRIAGTGSAIPDKRLTNADLEQMVDTSDEWIVKRTGIQERRIVDPRTEGTFTLARDALARALEAADMQARDLDLIIFASVTAEMTCPSNANRVSAALDAGHAAAFDLVAACSGFVYATNLADTLIRSGRHRHVGVIGCDAMSTVIDYSDRSLSILFGDVAGAVVLVPDENPGLGCIHQTMGADGGRWPILYIPRRPQEVPADDRDNPIKLGCLRMAGREVFKWGVIKLREVIEEALQAANLTPDDVAQIICHQSNARILEAVREKLGIDPDKMYMNIHRVGNSSAGSIGLCFDELVRDGRVGAGDKVMFAAIGGGLTWAGSVWQL